MIRFQSIQANFTKVAKLALLGPLRLSIDPVEPKL
jgi:hypothetical protein